METVPRNIFNMSGIAREEDDLDPIYGIQWRRCGAPYIACDTSHDGTGIDQLQQVIETLKNNPASRRMIVASWNPTQLNEMALPP